MLTVRFTAAAVCLSSLTLAHPTRAQGVDLYGDPLPPGVVARLGTLRYRHPGWHKRVYFLPDSETVAIGTSDNTIRSWNARTGEMIHELDLDGARLSAFCLSADGRTVATVCARTNRLTRESRVRLGLWNAITWRSLAEHEWVEQGAMAFAQCIALSHDESKIALGTMGGTIALRDVATGEQLQVRQLVRGDVQSLAFSADDSLLAAAGQDGVHLWSYATDKAPETLPDLSDGLAATRFSPDGALLAVMEGYEDPWRVYNFAAKTWGQPFETKSGYSEHLSFTPDHKQALVAGYQSQTVDKFDVDTGKLVGQFKASGMRLNDAALSPDGNLLVAIAGESAFSVWDATTGERLDERFVGHLETPYDLAFTPDGRHVVTGCLDGTVRIWNAETGAQERLLAHERWAAGVAVSPDGKRIVSCGLDDTVRLWDAATGDEVFKLPGHGNEGGSGTTEVAFSPDGERFYSFGGDMDLRTYDTKSGQEVADVPVKPSGMVEVDGKPQAADPFGAIGRGGFALGQARFTPDTKQLLLGEQATGARIHVIDVATGKELKVIESDDGFQDFGVTPDGKLLVTFEKDPQAGTLGLTSRMQVRDRKTNEVVNGMALPGRYRQFAISPSGRLLGVAILIYSEDLISLQRLLLVFDMTTLQPIAQIENSSNASIHMAFSADESRLAVAEEGGAVAVWDLDQLRAGGVERQ